MIFIKTFCQLLIFFKHQDNVLRFIKILLAKSKEKRVYFSLNKYTRCPKRIETHFIFFTYWSYIGKENYKCSK